MNDGIRIRHLKIFLIILPVFFLMSCATSSSNVYIDSNMDFAAVKSIGVMPFVSLARDPVVADRVRDVFINKLLATGAVYVLPMGEVARGATRAEIQNPSVPSPEEVVKLGGLLKVQAIITGTVREYGEVRSGTVSSNIVSISLQMLETQTGKVVWSASSTEGGVNVWDRLFGGGGEPMNKVTEKAVNDLISKLFK